ncbi:MAG TPA: AAA family ATPase [Tenuifilum sp.]|nr:AAA family ATPase [Tenuifilum sp.]
MNLNKEQKDALAKLIEFVKGNEHDTFILKGYAGTGKTVLVNELLQSPEIKEIPVQLLASTGRAAKILSLKTNRAAQTVHSYIYTFVYDEFNEEKKTIKVQFALKELNIDLTDTIYIVDEASMLSNHKDNTMEEGLQFGSGKLLTDFFTFCQGRKVIFVGDPAQLPPINTLFSPALNEEYLQNTFKRKVTSTFLTQVMRYSKTSGIYYNTSRIREQLEKPVKPKYLSIIATQFPDMDVVSLDYMLIENYVNTIKKKGYESAILVAYTNKTCNQLNELVRKKLFTNYQLPQKGDLCIVAKNNYLHGIENGQHIYIQSISEKEERVGQLHFRDIIYYLITPNGIDKSREYCGKVIMEFLLREKPTITHEEEYELYKRFFATIDPEKRKNKQYVIDAFSKDPYIHALRIRYGYAITCHKAQGGEWDTLFLILEKVLFGQTKDNPEFLYRWVYTALTRPVNKVVLLDNICIK